MDMTDKSGRTIGEIEYCGHQYVKGYAVDLEGGQPPEIEVVAGGRVLDTFVADGYRWDLRRQGLGNGRGGFVYALAPELMGDGVMEIGFRFRRTGRPLKGSPVTIRQSAEARHIPLATTDLTGRRVLVLAPHPDDESLACGGALILHRDAQDPVKIVFLTDGSRGDAGGGRSQADYARLREMEGREAAGVLGVDDIEFWGIGDRRLAQDATAERRLSALLADYRPDLIYAPSPMEFHPDHRAAATHVWRAVQNSVGYVIAQVSLMVLFSLITALVLNRKIKRRGFFRGVSFYPVLLSPIVVALIWKWILQENGVLNAVIQAIGFAKVPFMVDASWARFWVVVINVWAYIGFYTLILLAGLQAIPADMYEAADMDGANDWQSFWKITLPLLMPNMLVVLVLALIRAVQVFDVVFAFTGGGPGTATQFLVQFIYDNGFSSPAKRYGIAAAASLLMAGSLVVLTLLQLRLNREEA